MKKQNKNHFSKMIMALLLPFTIVSAVQAEAKPGLKKESLQIFNKESTQTFLNYYEDSQSALEQFIAKSTQKESVGENGKTKILSDFMEKCGDQDYEDQLLVKESNQGPTVLSFTCFQNNSIESGESFIFEIDLDTKRMLSATQLSISNDSQGPAKQKHLKIAVKESANLVVSAAISGAIAQTVFSNQPDKLKHATVSSVLASIITYASYHLLNISPNKAALIGFSVTCAVGAGKEVWDAHHPGHTPDVKDFIADSIGCFMGSYGARLSFEF